jgi:hypothetical protein
MNAGTFPKFLASPEYRAVRSTPHQPSRTDVLCGRGSRWISRRRSRCGGPCRVVSCVSTSRICRRRPSHNRSGGQSHTVCTGWVLHDRRLAVSLLTCSHTRVLLVCSSSSSSYSSCSLSNLFSGPTPEAVLPPVGTAISAIRTGHRGLSLSYADGQGNRRTSLFAGGPTLTSTERGRQATLGGSTSRAPSPSVSGLPIPPPPPLPPPPTTET